MQCWPACPSHPRRCFSCWRRWPLVCHDRNAVSNRLRFAWASLRPSPLNSTAHAVPLDFTTFQTAAYPHADSDGIITTDFFPVGIWAVTTTTASHNSNADSSVLHTPTNVINKRITGTLTPGTDDDVVGFVVGFEPGEQLIGSTGEYFLIDWKGASQGFDVFDFASPGFTPFHNLTGTGNMPVGLALSRVTGSANGDELWQHVDFAASPATGVGGVTQLARGSTLGSAPYDRVGGAICSTSPSATTR